MGYIHGICSPKSPSPFFFLGRGEFGSPPNAWFLGYTRVHNPDGSSIDLSAFVEFTAVTDTQVQGDRGVQRTRGPRSVVGSLGQAAREIKTTKMRLNDYLSVVARRQHSISKETSRLRVFACPASRARPRARFGFSTPLKRRQ